MKSALLVVCSQRYTLQDSLAGLVGSELGRDALSGEVFIFMGARCQQVKLLWFQGDGFGLYYRKLEKGTFERPVVTGKGVELTAGELMCLMEGIVLKSVVHRRDRAALVGKASK